MHKGICDNCRQPAWVNVITKGGRQMGFFCADCFDFIDKDEPNRNRTVKSSGTDHNNPWQDNAIRALEEDR